MGGLLATSLLVVCIGQTDRELVPPDDLREVEVAREMTSLGDAVIPHLAGLPFVEKPPGFQFLVHLAYGLAGGPSAAAARAVSCAFAIASLCAVFLLGRATLGLEGGALATAFLAVASRFCRTAHVVLLDNALTATSAFALLCAWQALRHPRPAARRRWYAAAAFCLGLAFLVKGPIGPVLFAAGFAAYLALSHRGHELRLVLHPLPVAAFLAPVLVWLIPFVARAPADLIREFFVANQLGRFLDAYHSHVRPFYFYLVDLWPALLPTSLLLLPAVHHAWRHRREAGSPEAYFLAMAVGPLVPLSLSLAKFSVYALPAYPAFALLVAAWAESTLSAPMGSRTRALAKAFGGLALLFSVTTVGATAWLAPSIVPATVAASTLVALSVWMWRAWAHGAVRDAVAGAIGLIGIGWLLWFTGPIRDLDVARRSIRAPVEQALSLIGDRPILLFRPDDGLRGAMGFFRDRTARELSTPEELTEALRRSPESVLVVRCPERSGLQRVLLDSAQRSGRRLEEIAGMRVDRDSWMMLYAAASRPREVPGVATVKGRPRSAAQTDSPSPLCGAADASRTSPGADPLQG